jgi:hypothetical protein
VHQSIETVCLQNAEEMAMYTKLHQRLTAERRAVAVLRTEALRERTARTTAALDAASLPCAIGETQCNRCHVIPQMPCLLMLECTRRSFSFSVVPGTIHMRRSGWAFHRVFRAARGLLLC